MKVSQRIAWFFEFNEISGAKVKVWAAAVLSVVILGIGLWLSFYFQCADWFSMSGSVVVGVTIVLGWLHFKHKVVRPIAPRIGGQDEDAKRKANALYYERLGAVKKQFVCGEVVLGVIGTLVWGFGNLLPV